MLVATVLSGFRRCSVTRPGSSTRLPAPWPSLATPPATKTLQPVIRRFPQHDRRRQHRQRCCCAESTPPATTTRPPVMKRSLTIPPAPTTLPTVLKRSLATPPAATTRPMAPLRSLATPPAAETRLRLECPASELERWFQCGFRKLRTLFQYDRLQQRRYWSRRALPQPVGHDNTAEGYLALLNSTGSNNTALGSYAGSNLTTGSNNIDIGAPGVAGDSNKIRIGKQGTQNGTFIAGIFGVSDDWQSGSSKLNRQARRCGLPRPVSRKRSSRWIRRAKRS